MILIFKLSFFLLLLKMFQNEVDRFFSTGFCVVFLATINVVARDLTRELFAEESLCKWQS